MVFTETDANKRAGTLTFPVFVPLREPVFALFAFMVLVMTNEMKAFQLTFYNL